MAHNAYPAGWVSPVPAGHVPGLVEYELLWDQLYAAINGDAGGTWAPSAFITVGGSGFEFTGTGHSIAASARVSVASTGEIRVLSGGFLSVRSGGAFDLYGAGSIKSAGNLNAESGSTLTLASGAAMTAASGSTVNLSGVTAVRGAMTIKASGGPGTLNVETGCAVTAEAGSLFNVYTNLAKVQSGGQVSFLDGSTFVSEDGATAIWLGSWTFGNDEWPQLSPARTWTRASFDIISMYGEGTPEMYWGLSPATNGPCVATSLATVTGKKSILRLLDLPVGGTLTSVVVTSQGFQGASTPTQVPTYRLVSWGDTSAAGLTNLSSVVTDAHTGGNWLSTALDNTITASGSGFVIDPALNYGVLVTHPYDGGFGTQGIFYRADSTGTVSAIEL